MALWISILNRSNSWLMKRALLYFQGTTFALTHRYSTAADQTEGKQQQKKKNRKKIITCFSQTCIHKYQAFYLLGQMAQAHWSHTFLVLLEDREWPLTSHLPPSFSERHQTPPTVTPPLSEHFTTCSENSAPERGKPGGSVPQLCPGTEPVPQCCQHWAVLQK